MFRISLSHNRKKSAERGDGMKKRTVITGILILLLIVVLLGSARYWMAGQRQITHEQGTLVKICESFQKENRI